MNKIAIALIVGVLASAAHAVDNHAAQNTAVSASTATQNSKTPAPANTMGQETPSQNRY